VCRLPSPGNVLRIGGFDQWDGDAPFGWGTFATGVSATEDVEGCAGSKALYWAEGGLSTCIAIQPSKTYNIGGTFKGGAAGAVLSLIYYPDTSCGQFSSSDELSLPVGSSWQTRNWKVTTPAGALSANFTFESTAQYVDQVYLNPDAAQF
jgi:hypothetical protein